MGARTKVLATALPLALLLSGCLFSVKGYRVSSPTMSPGKTVTVTLDIFPTFHSAESRKGWPFIIFLQEGDAAGQLTLPSTGRVFDKTTNFGTEPRALPKDNVLRDEILNDERCLEYRPILDDTNWSKAVFRTQNEVNIKDRGNKVAKTTFPTKLPSSATNLPASLNWVLIVGTWMDSSPGMDGTPGVPEETDDIQCTSAIQSSYALQAGP